MGSIGKKTIPIEACLVGYSYYCYNSSLLMYLNLYMYKYETSSVYTATPSLTVMTTRSGVAGSFSIAITLVDCREYFIHKKYKPAITRNATKIPTAMPIYNPT